MAAKIPYGYEIRDGNICTSNDSKVVKLIYKLYIKKRSKAYIVNYLNKKGYKYNTGGNWYFRLVDQILKNEKYCGKHGYPKIIDKKIFDEVKVIREARYNNHIRHNQIINSGRIENAYHKKIICAECNEEYIRLKRIGMKNIWVCKNSQNDVCNSRFISEDELNIRSIELFRYLKLHTENIAHRESMYKGFERVYYPALKLPTKTYIEELGKIISDEIFSIPDYDMTEELIDFIESNSIKLENVSSWINQLIKNIIIFSSGKIQFVLKNGKMINMEYQIKEEQ